MAAKSSTTGKKPAAEKTTETENQSFEDAISALETIVEQMETGELSLEGSLQAFEKGVALTRSCQQALDDAELKVQTLIKGTEEDPQFAPMSDAGNDLSDS